MSKTKRHHFIPVFYLKQFTNENNQFYIYDVKQRSFRDHGRLFYPQNQFYEHGGNTTYHDGESDAIEREFSKIDTALARVLQKIRGGESSSLTFEDSQLLGAFITMLYWRIPAHKNKVQAYIQNANSLSALGHPIPNHIRGTLSQRQYELTMLEGIKKDADFYKYMKLRLPLLTFTEVFQSQGAHYESVVQLPYAHHSPRLVSDNPVIYRRSGTQSLHTDECVYLISPQHLLVRRSVQNIKINNRIRRLMDMLSLLQANEYVSCTDKDYPESLYAEYQKHFTSIDQVRAAVFNCIQAEREPDLFKIMQHYYNT